MGNWGCWRCYFECKCNNSCETIANMFGYQKDDQEDNLNDSWNEEDNNSTYCADEIHI